VNDSLGIDTTKEIVLWILYLTILSWGKRNDPIQIVLTVTYLSLLFHSGFKDIALSWIQLQRTILKDWEISLSYGRKRDAFRMQRKKRWCRNPCRAWVRTPFQRSVCMRIVQSDLKFLIFIFNTRKRTLYKYSLNKTVEISKILEVRNDERGVHFHRFLWNEREYILVNDNISHYFQKVEYWNIIPRIEYNAKTCSIIFKSIYSKIIQKFCFLYNY